MNEAPWRISKGDPIYASWLNAVADAVLQRITVNRGRTQRIGHSLAIQIDEGAGGSGGNAFWAIITGYSTEEDSEGEPIENGAITSYSWSKLGNSSKTGEGAIDLYSGNLALLGEPVLMAKCPDGVYRFQWRQSFEAEMDSCDNTSTATIIDPFDATRTVQVERKAGFYEDGDWILLVPTWLYTSDSVVRWTVTDRIPMAKGTPLSGEYSGDTSDDMAPVQDSPTLSGCEA